MSVRGNLYLALAAELYRMPKEGEEPLFKTIDLFNNQFEYLDVEKPFLYPCAFIEFVKWEWKQLGGGMQEGKLIFNVHIGYKNGMSTQYKPGMDAAGLENLELIDEVYRRLCAFGADDLITGVTRTGSLYDHNHDQINAHIEQFMALVYDDSAVKKLTRISVKPNIQYQEPEKIRV